MNTPLFSFQSNLFLIIIFSSFIFSIQAQSYIFDRNYIVDLMTKVNNYQVKENGNKVNRNWKQATYYTGVMAFYKATYNQDLLKQAINWSERNDWETGNEFFFPANRLTCTQTYLQIFSEMHDSAMILKVKEYLDAELLVTEPAYLRGWYYIDALYVGIPPFMMLSAITGNHRYADYGNLIFWDLADQLFDKESNLFYRDNEARFKEKSRNGKKVLWSRGNGWAMASLPRILSYLPEESPYYKRYTELFQKMAVSLANCQGEDGLWRTNLADADDYAEPESSGSAFFTYAIAWGINNGVLPLEEFEPVIRKSWKGLCSIVDETGRVGWGQPEARKPGIVNADDSDEFVTGAFLLAGSEILRFIQ